MKITLLMIGLTDKSWLREGMQEYARRLIHYLPFEVRELPDIKNSKNLTEEQQKEKEGKLLLDRISPGDDVVLLDVAGKEFTSPQMAAFIEKKMTAGTRNLIFIIGGPYGFAPAVMERANGRLSLSRLTFPHQLVRLLFLEQLYRCMTILKGEPYHHE